MNLQTKIVLCTQFFAHFITDRFIVSAYQRKYLRNKCKTAEICIVAQITATVRAKKAISLSNTKIIGGIIILKQHLGAVIRFRANSILFGHSLIVITSCCLKRDHDSTHTDAFSAILNVSGIPLVSLELNRPARNTFFSVLPLRCRRILYIFNGASTMQIVLVRLLQLIFGAIFVTLPKAQFHLMFTGWHILSIAI